MAQTIFKSSAVKTAITMKLSDFIREHLAGLGYEFDNGYEGFVKKPHDDAQLVDFHAKYDLDPNAEFVTVHVTQVRVAHYRCDSGTGESSGRFTAQMVLRKCVTNGLVRYRPYSTRLQDHDLEEKETFKILSL